MLLNLFSPWLLFVCQAPGCDCPFSPRVFASAGLLGEVHSLLGDKTRSRDGKSSFQGKHDISMEKYLCMLFLILKLCLGMLPWTLKSELALMLSRFYPPFLYNFKLLPLLTRQFCLGGFCVDCFQSTVSLIPSLFSVFSFPQL